VTRVSLPFDRGALDVDLPDGAIVLRPNPTTPLADPTAAVRQVLANGLRLLGITAPDRM